MIINGKSLFALLASFLGMTAAAADSETRSVVTMRTIAASPQQVLDAFLDDRYLKGWWKVSRSLVEPKKGGIWSITWDDWGDGKTHHAWVGVIEEITPNRLLVGNLVMIEPDMPLFGPMQLEVSVAKAEGGTMLTVSHRGYRYGGHWDRIHALVVDGWDHVLDDMQAWVKQGY